VTGPTFTQADTAKALISGGVAVAIVNMGRSIAHGWGPLTRPSLPAWQVLGAAAASALLLAGGWLLLRGDPDA
jgi:hypothetical protein